jgi:hypothetical protein
MSDGLTPRQRLEQARARRLQAEDARQGYRPPPTSPPPPPAIRRQPGERNLMQAEQARAQQAAWRQYRQGEVASFGSANQRLNWRGPGYNYNNTRRPGWGSSPMTGGAVVNPGPNQTETPQSVRDLRNERLEEIDAREERSFIRGLINQFTVDAIDLSEMVGDSVALRFTAFLDYMQPGNWNSQERTNVFLSVREFFQLVAGTTISSDTLRNLLIPVEFPGSYNREDDNYRFTDSTVDWLQSNPLDIFAAPTDDPELLAQQVLTYIGRRIEQLAELGIRIDIPDLEQMNAKEALEVFLAQLGPIVQHGAPVMDVGAPMHPNYVYGQHLSQIDHYRVTAEFETLAGLYSTFGIDASEDVIEFAQLNLGLQGRDADDAEALARDYIIDLIYVYDPSLLQDVDLDLIPINQLIAVGNSLLNNTLNAGAVEMQGVIATIPDETFARAQTSAFGMPLIWNTQSYAESLPEDFYTQGLHLDQLNYGLGLVAQDVSQVTKLMQAYDPTTNYIPTMMDMIPPDLRLAVMVASMTIDLVDWVVTSGDVISDFVQGYPERALENLTLMVLPGLAGWMNDVPRIRGSGGNDLGYGVYSGFPFNVNASRPSQVEVSRSGRIGDINNASGLFTHEGQPPLALSPDIDISVIDYSTSSPISESELARVTSEMFGFPLTAHQVAALSGAYFAENITIALAPNGFLIRADGSEIVNWQRSITRDRYGQILVRNIGASLSEQSQRSGIGTQATIVAVEAAGRLGVDRIEVEAIRSPGVSGYYVWPRLGFDADLPDTAIAQLQDATELPANVRAASTFRELMATPEGRRWWFENGSSVSLTFEIGRGSNSEIDLRNYVQLR